MPADPFPKFQAEALRNFLTAIDRHLDRPATLIVIGGSACAIGYGVGLGTNDVDTFNSIDDAVQVAIERARSETFLEIPVSRSPVADVPREFEERLQPVMQELVHLTVLVPEKHDLALSKTLRCNEHDLDAIEALHRLHPLDQETLVERYMDELSAAIGDPRRLDQNLVLLVRCLYGEIDADRVKKRLMAWRASSP